MHATKGVDCPGCHTPGVGEAVTAHIKEHPLIGFRSAMEPHGVIQTRSHHRLPVLPRGMRQDNGIERVVVAEVGQAARVEYGVVRQFLVDFHPHA